MSPATVVEGWTLQHWRTCCCLMESVLILARVANWGDSEQGPGWLVLQYCCLPMAAVVVILAKILVSNWWHWEQGAGVCCPRLGSLVLQCWVNCSWLKHADILAGILASCWGLLKLVVEACCCYPGTRWLARVRG